MDNDSSPATPAGSGADDTLRYHLRKLQRHPAYRTTQLTLRAVRRFVPRAWRQATSGMRALPGAVIVGVAKSGTSQLFSYTLRHPRCFRSYVKEVHYFSYHWQRPLSWYRSHFAFTRTVEAAGGLCLEASPSYILSAETLERMRRVLPQAKLIVILRDPVRRAFSLYQNQKRSHSESRSFDDIVRESIANAPLLVRHDRPLPSIPGSIEPCIWDGYYASQLTALLSIYPREQVLILDSADLFDDTNAACQRVFDFLGLESYDVQPDKIYNRGYYRETIDPATAEMLREHYRPHDEWLVELTGRRFRWMDEAAGKQEQRAA